MNMNNLTNKLDEINRKYTQYETEMYNSISSKLKELNISELNNQINDLIINEGLEFAFNVTDIIFQSLNNYDYDYISKLDQFKNNHGVSLLESISKFIEQRKNIVVEKLFEDEDEKNDYDDDDDVNLETDEITSDGDSEFVNEVEIEEKRATLYDYRNTRIDYPEGFEYDVRSYNFSAEADHIPNRLVTAGYGDNPLRSHMLENIDHLNFEDKLVLEYALFLERENSIKYKYVGKISDTTNFENLPKHFPFENFEEFQAMFEKAKIVEKNTFINSLTGISEKNLDAIKKTKTLNKKSDECGCIFISTLPNNKYVYIFQGV